jgi:hypothetical protein
LLYYDANSGSPATSRPAREGGEDGGLVRSVWGGGEGARTEQLIAQSVYSWKEVTLHCVKYRQNSGAGLLVNVFVKLSSPAPTCDRGP